MKFHFRLERLLHLREAAEKQQATELGRAAEAEGAKREASVNSAEALNAVHSQVTGSVGAPIAAGLYHAYGLTVEAAEAQQAEAEDALRQAEQVRAEEEARFQDARMARRAVERLRERRVEEWGVETGRAEQKELDEIAQRHARKPEEPS